MTDLEEEFEKAVAYELSDEDIERARLLIGDRDHQSPAGAHLRGHARRHTELGAGDG